MRMTKLAEYVQLLRKLTEHSREEFVREPFVHGNAERYLQLAIQSAIDIGNHLLSDKKLPTPKDYREIFLILSEAGLLSRPLAERLASAAGLRNILVHDYLDIDRDRIYEFLRERLGDFEQFARAVEPHLRP